MRRSTRTANVFEAADIRRWRGHDVVDAEGCPLDRNRRPASSAPPLSRRMERRVR
jgi:hypothetical protein